MVAGARRNEIRALTASSDPLFAHGAGEARVLTPERPAASPSFAALVNGCACTALELDEGIRPTGHPAAHVVPAALAAGQALHASGEQLLAAIVSGYEVAARLFEAWRLHEALHPHGHLGAVGGAVAVARLRGAPPGPPALIAASLPLMTTWDACFEGATVRHAYTGVAAAMGILANQLAVAGLTGAQGAQASAFGRLAGALRSVEPLTEPVEPDTLRIDRNYFQVLQCRSAVAQRDQRGARDRPDGGGRDQSASRSRRSPRTSVSRGCRPGTPSRRASRCRTRSRRRPSTGTQGQARGFIVIDVTRSEIVHWSPPGDGHQIHESKAPRRSEALLKVQRMDQLCWPGFRA